MAVIGSYFSDNSLAQVALVSEASAAAEVKHADSNLQSPRQGGLEWRFLVGLNWV